MKELCMKNMHCHDSASWGLLALRITVGLVLVFHGFGKLFGHTPGMEAFTGMVGGMMGFPMPIFFAYAAALIEFFGGLALLLGIGTCVAGSLSAIVMAVAFIFVHKFSLLGGDAALVVLGGALALAGTGAGRFSLDAVCRKQNACCSAQESCGCCQKQ